MTTEQKIEQAKAKAAAKTAKRAAELALYGSAKAVRAAHRAAQERPQRPSKYTPATFRDFVQTYDPGEAFGEPPTLRV